MSANTTERVSAQDTQSGISTKISASMGNDSLSDGDNIYEGQTIRYKVTLTNNSGKDYNNVEVKANQKNGYMWDTIEHEVFNPLFNKNFNEHYYEISSSNEKKLATLASFKDGESYTYEYEASVYLLNNEKIDGTQTYGNISIKSQDSQVNENIATIKNQIKSAKLQINLMSGSTEEVEVSKESVIKKQLSLKNLTGEKINNVQLKIAFSPKLNPAVSLGEDNQAKVLEQSEEKGTDGITTVNLKLSVIEAGETINIDLLPSTTSDFDTEKDEAWMLAEAVTEDQDSYVSNKATRKIYNISKNIQLTQQALKENGEEINTNTDIINSNEKVTLVATIKNNESKNVGIDVSYKVDDKISIENAKIANPEGEEDVTDSQSNTVNKEKQILKPGEQVTVTISGTADAFETDELVNELEATDIEYRNTMTDTLSLNVNKQSEPVIDDNNEEDNKPGDDELPSDITIDNNGNNNGNSNSGNNSSNNNSGNNNNSNSSNEDNTSGTYVISGTAWKDEDRDGKRSDSEERIADMTVDAMNADNGQIVASTKTDADGKYQFDVENGNYIILFHYDNSVYTTTTYQSNNAEEDSNSDAIERDVTINDSISKLGATDTLTVNKNTENIDIGLVTRNTFDLKIDKYVSKITVNSNSKTTEYNQKENTKLAKAEIKSKNLDGSLVVIEYKIKVTNAGDVAGYARNIIDYMPSTLSFNSSLNPEWYISGNNIYTTSLANTKIEPGETKELTVVLTKTMSETNTGLINNKAEISESSNEMGIKDATNDKGSADVIISVSTGALVNYVTTTIITLVILIGLAYLVNKKYLSKKI